MSVMLERLWVAALTASTLLGCASQRETGQALTVVGAAAVIVGAASRADSSCHLMTETSPGQPVAGACHRGLLKKQAGTALALAGAGVAAAGYALQMAGSGPDTVHASAPGASASNPQQPSAPRRSTAESSEESSNEASDGIESEAGEATPAGQSCVSIVCVEQD